MAIIKNEIPILEFDEPIGLLYGKGKINYFVNNRRQDRGKSRLHLECICPFLWTAHRFLPIESNRVRLSKTLWNFNVFSLP